MYNVAFNFARQQQAADGYVVLYTNPRGSTGYGSAFGNQIKNAYPGKDFDDLMAAVDTVIGRGYIDTNNMFVYGCSGGGVLTAWTVGHTNRFARGGVDVSRDRLGQLRRHHGRRLMVLQFCQTAVGGPVRTSPPKPVDVRWQGDDADSVDDGRE